jgi:hypothetical protein
MENVAYFMLWRLHICSVKRPNYGKRIIFHALQAADMLCEAPELWKRNVRRALEAADMLCEAAELWKT